MTSPYPTRTDLEDQAAIEIGAAGSLRAAGKAQRPRQWQRGPIAAARVHSHRLSTGTVVNFMMRGPIMAAGSSYSGVNRPNTSKLHQTK